MQEVDINTLIVFGGCVLIENIPNDIIITGNINCLYIRSKYDKLDLSKVECNEIYYRNQEGESIKNHILPTSLKFLYCSNNQLTSLPDLPSHLQELICSYNQLTSLPDLPNSLQILVCSGNQLISLPDLPNSLKKLSFNNNKLTSFANIQLPNSLEILDCSHNKLTSLPDHLPDSLKTLDCSHNQLTSLPDFFHINHKIILGFYQDLPISYIPYNINIKLGNIYINKINIEDYPHNPITNQEKLDKYMDYVKNYQLNRIKSARK